MIIFNCSAFAQNTQLSQNEIVSLYQKIEKATNAHQSFSCNFTQTKHNSILTQDAKLRGEIHLQQPDNIAIIGTFPLQYSIIIKNTQPSNVISEREKDIIRCLVQGMSNKDIANHLYISVNTVPSTPFQTTSSTAAIFQNRQYL